MIFFQEIWNFILNTFMVSEAEASIHNVGL